MPQQFHSASFLGKSPIHNESLQTLVHLSWKESVIAATGQINPGARQKVNQQKGGVIFLLPCLFYLGYHQNLLSTVRLGLPRAISSSGEAPHLGCGELTLAPTVKASTGILLRIYLYSWPYVFQHPQGCFSLFSFI